MQIHIQDSCKNHDYFTEQNTWNSYAVYAHPHCSVKLYITG